MARRPLARDGSVLPLVLLLVVLVATVQLAQFLFVEQVSDLTERAVDGLRAEALARAALAEATAVIARQSDEPGSAVGRALRVQLPGDRTPFTRRLDASELPLTRALNQQDPNRALTLSAVTATLSYREPLTPGSREEFAGLLDLAVDVVAPTLRGAARPHRLSRGFKMSRMALPEPLSGVTVLFRQPVFMARGRVDVNRAVAQLMGQDLPALQKSLGDILAELAKAEADAKKALSNPFTASAAKDALDFLDAIRPLYAGLQAGPEFPKALGTGRRYRPYPGGSFMLAARGSSVDLAALDVQERVGSRMPAVDAGLTQVEAARLKVVASLSSSSMGSGAVATHRDFVQSLRDLLVRIDALLAEAVAARDAMEVVGGDSDAIVRALGLVDPALLARPLSALERRAHVLITEGSPPGGQDVSAKLRTTLERLAAADPGAQAVVVVRNPTSPLTLTGVVPGRVMVAVQGSLTITDLRRGGPDDVLTVIALGSVRVSGTCEASLVTPGGALRIDSARISGSLLLWDLSASSSGALEGEVRQDGRPVASAGPDGTRLVLSPWTRAREAGTVP